MRALPSPAQPPDHDDMRQDGERGGAPGDAIERISLQALIDVVPEYLWVKDANSRFVVVNRTLALDCGHVHTTDMIGLTDFDLHPPEVAREFAALEKGILNTGKPITGREEQVIDATGQKKWLLSTKMPLRNEQDEIVGIVGIAHNVTERVKAKNELRRTQAFLHLVIESVPEAIIVRAVRDRRVALMNRAAEEFFGMTRAEMLGKAPEEIYVPEFAARARRGDEDLLRKGELFFDSLEINLRGKGKRTASVSRKLLSDESGEPEYMLTVIQDITERKRAEARIAHLALHDPLTNLPNRAMFNEQLERTLKGAATSGKRFAVFCIDLDRLKEVNDLFGHAAGDQLLRDVANRLLSAAQGGFLARLGGDEFAVIVPDVKRSERLRELSQRFLGAIERDFTIQGAQIRAGLSLGVAVFPNDGRDARALLANADAALYRAKAEGRGIVRFFRAEMDEQRREHHALRHDLSLALDRDELVMHYQPQARVTGEIVGFESLLRWRHPVRGYVPPSVFIPIAEESRLIERIGEWSLRNVCRQAALWAEPLCVAVNLSPVQFRHGDLANVVHSILLETGLAAERLELEITEGLLMTDSSRALSLLRRLKSLGVRIVMDDFGKGYSSLSYLQSFPFDKIKIDRDFVSKIEQRPQSAAILRATVGLARGLGLSLVAEGVETREELAFLAGESCDYVQGYLLGRPRPAEDYAAVTNGCAHRRLRSR